MAYTTIDDPSAYFQTALYSGDSSSVTVTNDGNSDLQPDWLWFKKRNTTGDHNTFDTSRGLTERLFPNLTSAVDSGSNGISALTNGFTSGTFYGDVNGAGNTFVTWQWKCNGGTRTTFTESGNNPGGGYQANTTAGFSIVDYTGTGALGTIAHGLGVAPTVVFVKGRDDGHAWIVKHSGAGNPVLVLNATDAASSGSTEFNNTAPTSSVFTVNTAGGTNQDGEKFIAYCFAPIQGYSKFGSFEGNNNADGPFVYTGFKPAWIMIKNIDAAKVWFIWDNARDTYNVANHTVEANASSAEANTGTGATNYIDMLSNGFKVRQTGSHLNPDSETVIYMAFAESPFVSSEGVPTTAR